MSDWLTSENRVHGQKIHADGADDHGSSEAQELIDDITVQNIRPQYQRAQRVWSTHAGTTGVTSESLFSGGELAATSA